MSAITIEQIEEQLRELPPEKLSAVFDFVSRIAHSDDDITTLDVMLAAEDVLCRDWETPEEDASWAHL